MKTFYRWFLCVWFAGSVLNGGLAPVGAETRIGKHQIEDVFLEKDGGEVYGDVRAATSVIAAGTLALVSTPGVFYITQDPHQAVIRSNVDLVLDPTQRGTAGAVIVAATTIRFPNFLGDKLTFFSHSYKIGISPFSLDLTSDRDFHFNSDTSPDLLVVEGDQGDVTAKNDLCARNNIQAGNVYSFLEDTVGDKILLYGDLYKLSISDDTLNFFSDRDFKWHSDLTGDAMTLDADTGCLTLKGPLQLPVYDSLPAASAAGSMVYLDHPSDNSLDGVYVSTGGGWQKL